MDGPEKHAHVVTGNTPNKPTAKSPHEQEVEGVPEEKPARRALAFQENGSPLQKVFVYFPWPLISLFSDLIFTQQTTYLQKQFESQLSELCLFLIEGQSQNTEKRQVGSIS